MTVRAGIHFKLHRNFIYTLGCLISIEQLSLIAMIPGLYTLVWISQMCCLTECKVLMHVQELISASGVVISGLQLALLIL